MRRRAGSFLVVATLIAGTAGLPSVCDAQADTSGSTGATANSFWITGYYPHWWYARMPPEAIDLDALTHIVIFSANPTRDSPYLDVLVPGPAGEAARRQLECGVLTGQTSNYLERTVHLAHSHGVKVLLSVGGIWGPGRLDMQWIAEDADRTNTFAQASVDYARSLGLDGIELDWEFPFAADRDNHTRLIQAFRTRLDQWTPRGLFVDAVAEAPGPFFGYDRAAMVAAFDQINAMTYEMYAGDWQDLRTGYNSPLYVSTEFPGYNGYAIDQPGHGPKEWIAQGYPPSKIGLGISFVTTEFYDVQPPVQPAQHFGTHAWGYVPSIPATAERFWDDSSKVPWARWVQPSTGSSVMCTYETESSCTLKVLYAKTLGIGGVMIYELGAGFFEALPEGQRSPLLTAVKEAARPFKDTIYQDGFNFVSTTPCPPN